MLDIAAVSPRVAIYWSGIALWVIGFVLYLAARERRLVQNIGFALTVVGLVVTAIPYAMVGPVDAPAALDPATVVGYVWIAGFALVIASWFGWVSGRVGWAGLCIGLASVAYSWFW